MAMSTLTVEDVVTPEQWRRAVALRNSYNPDGPVTVERAMNYEAAEKPGVPKRRFLMSRDGRDLSYGTVIQQYWTPSPGLYGFHLMMAPGDEGIDEGVEFAESQVREFGGNEATCWYRTDRPALGDALLRRGYIEGQRNPVACLDLLSFDRGRWNAQSERIAADGYEIVDLLTYGKANPDTWKWDLWRIEMDIFADVPLPDPFVEVPFEDWVRDLDANEMKFEWQFFALRNGRPVALTQVFANWVDSTIAHTGLTGVSREHRRQGLATALKAQALTRIKDAGVQRIYTDNEEKNPMFSLNLALGFREVYATVNMKRSLV